MYENITKFLTNTRNEIEIYKKEHTLDDNEMYMYLYLGFE